MVGLQDILQHPEWDEFTEERKKLFLLAREYQHQEPFGAFAAVLSLHEGSVHDSSPPDVKCVKTFRHTLHLMIAKYGPRAKDGDLWRDYIDQSGCSECKQRYASQRQAMLTDRFLVLRRRNGLPNPAEMMELRGRYHQEVATTEEEFIRFFQKTQRARSVRRACFRTVYHLLSTFTYVAFPQCRSMFCNKIPFGEGFVQKCCRSP